MGIVDIRTGKPIAAPTFTRRKVLGGLAGILATGAAPAAFVRSAIGARTAAWSGEKLSAKSYAQDGLVAMWDGIENAGWGVHDASATTWVDLSGNGYDLTLNTGVFEDTALVSTGSFDLAHGTVALPRNDNNYHYEIVASSETVLKDTGFAFFTGGGYTGGYANTLVYLYAWAEYSRIGFLFGNPATLYSTGTDYTFSGIHQYSGTHSVCWRDSRAQTNTSFVDSNVTRYGSNVMQVGFNVNGTGKLPSGTKIHALRIYSSLLTDADRLHNYAVDKARFGLS